ncbi:lipase [Alcanivorax sp. N3-2A]|nr:lipase [Alcanivorax sp. N3-2A]|tara:strand:- start:33026 stop:34063 length:1038 start_codon:yes stop_codon:yes gene_type:complete
MSLQEKIERATVRSLMKLPGPVLGRLAGLVEKVNRERLDPRLRLLLALGDGRKGFHQLPLPQGRALYGQMIRMLDVDFQPVAETRDLRVPLAAGDGDFLVKLYRPKGAASEAPAIVYFHGGGFTIGSAEQYDHLCRYLANRTGAVVLNVDYRLAPEFPSPAAADDVLSAWRWLLENAAGLRIDATRLATMGDSAGGNLCIVAAQQAAAHGLTLPKLAVAVYPTTDGAMDSPSVAQLGGGQGGLDLAMMNWFRDHYLPDKSVLDDLRVSPLRNPDLAGQPTTVLVTATDPLRDEGLAYGEKLKQAGVTVINLDYPELVHGFITMGGAIPAARAAVNAICRRITERL